MAYKIPLKPTHNKNHWHMKPFEKHDHVMVYKHKHDYDNKQHCNEHKYHMGIIIKLHHKHSMYMSIKLNNGTIIYALPKHCEYANFNQHIHNMNYGLDGWDNQPFIKNMAMT